MKCHEKMGAHFITRWDHHDSMFASASFAGQRVELRWKQCCPQSSKANRSRSGIGGIRDRQPTRCRDIALAKQNESESISAVSLDGGCQIPHSETVASKREILAICDTAFSNVPQPTFWNGFKKTPGHAVAYGDGTTGLVSEREFNQMTFSEFVDVDSLTGSVSNPTTSPQNGNR